MRHLKLFEGYLDKYYTEITESEFCEGAYSDNLVRRDVLTRNEKLCILKGLKPEYSCDFGDGKEYTFSADIMVRGKISKCVIQKSDDEWFYVAFSKNNINSYRDADHYKCDQFEGVIRLLKDKEILD